MKRIYTLSPWLATITFAQARNEPWRKRCSKNGNDGGSQSEWRLALSTKGQSAVIMLNGEARLYTPCEHRRVALTLRREGKKEERREEKLHRTKEEKAQTSFRYSRADRSPSLWEQLGRSSRTVLDEWSGGSSRKRAPLATMVNCIVRRLSSPEGGL